MKPFTQTAAAPVEHRAPRSSTPVAMTKLWSGAGGLLALAVVFIALGIAGGIVLKAWEAFGLGVLFALLVGVPGVILGVYTWLEHRETYGHKDKAQPVDPGPAPIYFTRHVNVNGKPVNMDPEPANIGIKPDVLQYVLKFMQSSGLTSRRTLQPALEKNGIKLSQGQWTNLMAWLEDQGKIVNNGRAGTSLVDKLDDLIAELEAQIERW